ncbi:hypothetical protein NVP2095A_05 [Vibrio phage 2.095.A._10N.286.46.E10]|nr:hypothetical protein NVP2095A_05 [Vibrio phage 2.095.A._10N.286.46.E10]AUS02163.1 hypothetical protein NVP2095B_05 [Vibrio phage 2.095.B._10N.286.46.E10]
MKTFETEKGNIPEGATHYRNEDKNSLFTWLKVSDDIKLWCDILDDWRGIGSHVNCIMDKITPIPQTKEVEWVNGDACRYANEIKHEYIYIGEHPHGDGHYVFSEEKGITYIANGYLLEPETEAERKEREELEAAYDLYCTVQSKKNETSCLFVWFLEPQMEGVREMYLTIVRKTNYKVKGE